MHLSGTYRGCVGSKNLRVLKSSCEASLFRCKPPRYFMLTSRIANWYSPSDFYCLYRHTRKNHWNEKRPVPYDISFFLNNWRSVLGIENGGFNFYKKDRVIWYWRKAFCCKCVMFSATITKFIQLYTVCAGCAQNWYSEMLFCRSILMRVVPSLKIIVLM